MENFEEEEAPQRLPCIPNFETDSIYRCSTQTFTEEPHLSAEVDETSLVCSKLIHLQLRETDSVVHKDLPSLDSLCAAGKSTETLSRDSELRASKGPFLGQEDVRYAAPFVVPETGDDPSPLSRRHEGHRGDGRGATWQGCGGQARGFGEFNARSGQSSHRTTTTYVTTSSIVQVDSTVFSNDEPVTGNTSASLPQSDSHDLEVHGHICSACGMVFPTKSDHDKHTRYHVPEKDRPHQCVECKKGFFFEKDLKRHQSTKAHSTTRSDPGMKCSHCGKPFYRVDHRKRHERTCLLNSSSGRSRSGSTRARATSSTQRPLRQLMTSDQDQALDPALRRAAQTIETTHDGPHTPAQITTQLATPAATDGLVKAPVQIAPSAPDQVTFASNSLPMFGHERFPTSGPITPSSPAYDEDHINLDPRLWSSNSPWSEADLLAHIQPFSTTFGCGTADLFDWESLPIPSSPTPMGRSCKNNTDDSTNQ